MPDIKSTLKSNDTEEWLDVVFTRPIGYCWALFFKRLGVKPNTVTWLSVVLGGLGGMCLYFGPSTVEWHWFAMNVVGVLLLMWANFYDSADGQLARMTNNTSQFGRILDGGAGDVWYFFIYWSVVLRLWNVDIPFTHIHWGWIGFTLGAVDGFVVHTRQCRLADYYRNIHLFFLRGCAGELDNYPQQLALFRQMKWSEGWFAKTLQGIYVNHVHKQEMATPQFQRLMARLRERYGDSIPQSFCQRFRQLSFRILWCTNALTFNQRAIALYVACLLDIPWLVFLVEMGYLGIVCIYMKWYHEGFCRRLADEL